jgi:hypothetical protein
MTSNNPTQPQLIEREMRDDGRVRHQPRWCCAEPSVRPALVRAPRYERRPGGAVGGPSALAHAGTRQAEWMLELSEQLAERRYERREFGISRLEAEIEAARADARRAPRAPKPGGGRQGYVEPRTHAEPQRRTRLSGERAR